MGGLNSFPERRVVRDDPIEHRLKVSRMIANQRRQHAECGVPFVTFNRGKSAVVSTAGEKFDRVARSVHIGEMGFDSKIVGCFWFLWRQRVFAIGENNPFDGRFMAHVGLQIRAQQSRACARFVRRRARSDSKRFASGWLMDMRARIL